MLTFSLCCLCACDTLSYSSAVFGPPTLYIEYRVPEEKRERERDKRNIREREILREEE